MNVTPGAVSRLVKKLEVYLEIKLFQRTQYGLELTEPGVRFLSEISTPLEELQNAARRARRQYSDSQVRVICHPTFAARWLLPRWSDFYQNFPDIKVQITTTLNEVDLSREPDHDIAIQLDGSVKGQRTADNGNQQIVKSEHFLEVETLPVCSPTFWRQGLSEVEALDLLIQNVLIHSAPLQNEWKNWLDTNPLGVVTADGHASISQVDWRKGPEFPTLDLSIQAAIEGVGFAIAFADFVEDDLRSGRLVAPFEYRRKSSRSFHIQYLDHKRLKPQIDAYVNWLRGQA